jgi:protein-disulfide isomerase/uncharacterized membrane protein
MIPNAPAVSTFTPRVHPGVFAAGVVVLAVAVAASAVLSLEHLAAFALPGCGAGSPCAKLAASQWGKVPGVQWPVSFAGTAYFSGLLALWIATRGLVPTWARLVATLGALASAGFIGIMLGMGHNSVCPYCLTAHLANFAFLGLLGLAPRPELEPEAPLRAPAAALLTFVLVTAGLGIADSQAKRSADEKFEGERNASVADILNRGKTSTRAPGATGAAQPPIPAPIVTPVVQQQPTQPQSLPPAGVFTGRYRFGPEKAAIRIVMFTDYQCPDCKLLEGQVETVLAKYPSLSVSIKYFPFCSDCNPHIQKQYSIHPNACWAARAAEAAGMLYGPEGFHRMHRWLFDKGGVFTTSEELTGALTANGLNPANFIETMTGPETLRRVQADADEGNSYGLMTTPLIYINGAELKGWRAPDALTRTVDEVAKANPEPAGPEADHPMKAGDKFVDDWRNQERKGQAWPPPKVPRSVVPLNPRPQVLVTMFGDLMEPNCAEADKIIRDAVAGDPQVAYEFRYFPFERACNPNMPADRVAGGCAAARAAEAAAHLGGVDAYWRMHEWIMGHQGTFSVDAAKARAKTIGLDPEKFAAKMNSQEVTDSIAWDVSIGSRVGVPEIPRIFVNGTLVPRWKAPGGFVLERIIDEARKPPSPGAAQVRPEVPQIPGINAPIGR